MFRFVVQLLNFSAVWRKVVEFEIGFAVSWFIRQESTAGWKSSTKIKAVSFIFLFKVNNITDICNVS